MKTKTLLLALGLMSTLTVAHAENFQFQNIRVGGTGCPSDITQIVMAPDFSSASILFQSFESHVPAVVDNPKATPTISILNCNVFLDIKLPAGQKLDSLEISYDMRGHAFLDRGVSGNFKSFLISSNGLGTERSQGVQLLQEKNWLNTGVDQEEDFLVQATKSLSIASQCGRGANTDRVSIHLQHQLGSQILGGFERTNASGTITMDSSDLKGGIRLRANTSVCNVGPTPPGPGRNCRVVRVNGRAQMICQ
ncbi:MAG: DUF4360 domain-containing protein [Bacteriovorax sp.]|nr:DUF4360 domain-containing protein [Bacteriovorax sp.]